MRSRSMVAKIHRWSKHLARSWPSGCQTAGKLRWVNPPSHINLQTSCNTLSLQNLGSNRKIKAVPPAKNIRDINTTFNQLWIINIEKSNIGKSREINYVTGTWWKSCLKKIRGKKRREIYANYWVFRAISQSVLSSSFILWAPDVRDCVAEHWCVLTDDWKYKDIHFSAGALRGEQLNRS